MFVVPEIPTGVPAATVVAVPREGSSAETVDRTVARRLDATEAFQVVSGYRAPETNAARARVSRQGASWSPSRTCPR